MVFFWVELNLLKVAFLARKRGNELRKTLKTKKFFLRGGVKAKKPDLIFDIRHVLRRLEDVVLVVVVVDGLRRLRPDAEHFADLALLQRVRLLQDLLVQPVGMADPWNRIWNALKKYFQSGPRTIRMSRTKSEFSIIKKTVSSNST